MKIILITLLIPVCFIIYYLVILPKNFNSCDSKVYNGIAISKVIKFCGNPDLIDDEYFLHNAQRTNNFVSSVLVYNNLFHIEQLAIAFDSNKIVIDKYRYQSP